MRKNWYLKKKKSKEIELKKRYNSFFYRRTKTKDTIKQDENPLVTVELINLKYDLILTLKNKTTESLKLLPVNSFHRDNEVYSTSFVYKVTNPIRVFYFFSNFYFGDYEQLFLIDLKTKYKINDGYLVYYYPYSYSSYIKKVPFEKIFNLEYTEEHSPNLTKTQLKIKSEREKEHHLYRKKRLETRNRNNLHSDLNKIKNYYNMIRLSEPENSLLTSNDKTITEPFYCDCEDCLERYGKEVVIDEMNNINYDLIQLIEEYDELTVKVHDNYEVWDWLW